MKNKQMNLSDLREKDQKILAGLKEDELLIAFPKEEFGFNRNELRTLWRKAKKEFPKEATLDDIVSKTGAKKENRLIAQQNKLLVDRVELLEKENEALIGIKKSVDSYEIKPLPESNGGGEATAILLASDWHVAERVSKQSINGMNEYSVAIARKRAEEFFQVGLKLRNLEAKNTRVPRLVLALIGDFVTGNIHEENLSVCSLLPMDEAIEAKKMLKSGIDFLLKESDIEKIIIPCHAGNHSRITQKRRFSETEMGNSLELFIYTALADEYANEPRVEFLISRSYTSKLKVYDTMLRLHHGHSIRYLGGVGGLAVPTQRYRLRANTAWQADYDIFGHHHQKQMGVHFVCNGSLIGYNAYAQDLGLEYEPPSQSYLCINRRFKDIIDYRPIFFSV